jgi:uncharacterized protein (TIGR02246 family)
MRRPLILLSVFAVAACTSKPAATDSAKAADTGMAANAAQTSGDAKAAVDKIRDGWRDNANKKDTAAVANYYADDAVLVESGQPVATGRSAIQHMFAQQFPVSNTKSIDSKDFQSSGDLAVDYGEYTLEVTPPGQKAQTEHGYYMVELKKQSDGTWKITRHVSSVPKG